MRQISPAAHPFQSALGIIGPDSVDPNPAPLTPEISLRTSGGQVEVLWTKDGHDALEIQAHRGTGVWAFLAIDTRPDYTDTEPFHGSDALSKYRAFYNTNVLQSRFP